MNTIAADLYFVIGIVRGVAYQDTLCHLFSRHLINRYTIISIINLLIKGYTINNFIYRNGRELLIECFIPLNTSHSTLNVCPAFKQKLFTKVAVPDTPRNLDIFAKAPVLLVKYKIAVVSLCGLLMSNFE